MLGNAKLFGVPPEAQWQKNPPTVQEIQEMRVQSWVGKSLGGGHGKPT